MTPDPAAVVPALKALLEALRGKKLVPYYAALKRAEALAPALAECALALARQCQLHDTSGQGTCDCEGCKALAGVAELLEGRG